MIIAGLLVLCVIVFVAGILFARKNKKTVEKGVTIGKAEIEKYRKSQN
jgi:hypothetical protein